MKSFFIVLAIFTIFPFLYESKQVCNKGWSGYFEGYEGGYINNCDAQKDMNKWLSIFGETIEILQIQNTYFRGNGTFICNSMVIFRPGYRFPTCAYYDHFEE